MADLLHAQVERVDLDLTSHGELIIYLLGRVRVAANHGVDEFLHRRHVA